MIRFEGVTKAFHRRTVLDGLTLDVQPGQLVGLIGRNGAGKSTALRVLTGQLVPDAGVALVGGHDVQREPLAARRLLGYVPQGGELEPFLTGKEVLEFVASLRGVDPAEAAPLLERFELSAAADRLTREYSEGMTRRLALAAALLGRPPVLVLDEPLNGLDPKGVRLVRAALLERVSEGAAVLVTGHFLETLERISTRVVLIEAGHVARDLDRAALDALGASGRTLEDVFLEVVG